MASSLAAFPALGVGLETTMLARQAFAKRAQRVLDSLAQGREYVDTVGSMTGRWMKVMEKSTSGTFEVKRTDSLAYPVVATVDVTLLAEFTGLQPTESEAKSAPAVRREEYRLMGTYTPGDSDWDYDSGRVWTRTLGAWTTIAPAEMRRPAARRNVPHRWFWEFVAD